MGLLKLSTFFTYVASSSANLMEQKKFFTYEKAVQLPQDWFGTPTWPMFHFFRTPINFTIPRHDGNENVKNNNRFSKQNNNVARASHFFVHFFAVFARLRRETA